VSDSTEALSRTPLYPAHLEAGARLVPFAGWEMPVRYDGIREEHVAVRTHAGMFDVSHMGRIEIEGPAAVDVLMAVLSNDAASLPSGGAQYTLLLDGEGGVVDDLIAYRLGSDRFLLVTNASNHAEDLDLLGRAARDRDAFVRDVSAEWAMIAVQGPNAREIVGSVLGIELPDRNRILVERIGDRPAFVCGTGYTGEDGVELLVQPAVAIAIWTELLDSGVVPCGLGARDTLRLEACFHLHGNDLDREIDPVTAGLGWACRRGGGYAGAEAVEAIRQDGPARKMVPIVIDGEGIPRRGNEVLVGDRAVGTVTSGTLSPSTGRGIGLALVESDLATEGTELTVDVRGKRRIARVSSKPLFP
jgi:aminomethyltransferase